MSDLFKVHMLNELGKAKAYRIGQEFSTLLRTLEEICPDGRDLAIVKTKLQEASFFAKRAMAVVPENQEP